ncbi:MAG TPA: DUF732 domain-containing protein, partial [Mycobacterium sp.]|nr:DUF732 domain-containing protein [Mycobacterium sp.]
MAEPGTAADKTVGLNNDETVAAPNSAAADAADLAWSSDDDGADTVQRDSAGDRQSWRATWRIAAALVAAGLVLAGAIVFGRSLLTSDTKAAAPKPATPATPNSGATGSAASAAPSSIVSTPDQDNKYIQALNDRGISLANPDAAIANGKLVCDDIRRGVSVPQ